MDKTVISLDTIDCDYLRELYSNNKEIKTAINKLKSDVYNEPDESKFKNLRLYLFESFKTEQKSFLTLFMLKILYLIYINKDNKHDVLYQLIYNNKNKDIVIGIAKDKYLEVSEQTPRAEKSDISNEQSDCYPQNNYLFPFDISPLSTGRSNANDIFNRFIKQFQNNSNVVNKELLNRNNLILTLNKKNTAIILNYFNKMNAPVKSNTTQEQESEGIENIYSYKEYADKFNNITGLLKINDLKEDNKQLDKYYIPDESIKLSNIYTLLNKFGEFDFDFMLSPLIKRYNFSLATPHEIITRTKIRIVQKEFINIHEYELVVSKLKYVCPGCDQLVLINPNDTNTEIVHMCDLQNNKKTRISVSGVSPEIQTPIILYKCDVCTNYDDVIESGKKEEWMKDIYIYSFKKDITPGFYISDIVKFYDNFNVLHRSAKKTFVYLLLGFKKMQIQYEENQIIKNDSEIKELFENVHISSEFKEQFAWMKNVVHGKKKLPKHKIWNILFSIRQYYKNRFNIDIDDNGLYLQLTALLSWISRAYFKENKLAISIMGVGSISKTFPCQMVYNMVDLNYKYISDSARLTAAGMTGGINTSAVINGQTLRKFEQGAISNNGVVVFDECQSIFVKPEIQAIIKSIPQEEYEVAVVGGSKIRFDCTPVFLSNFNEFMQRYEKKIIDAYIIKYKSVYKFENERKLKNNLDITKFISKINLYQNIEYYYDALQDEILANVIYAVRKQYENERIDWKTGSQLEAMNRILFDVVVHRKLSQVEITIDESVLGTENIKEISMNENMPIQQIQEEIGRYIYGKDYMLDSEEKINLNNESNNSFEVQEQLKKLDKSIRNFLIKEDLGTNITRFFIQNVDNFDKKIQNLVYKVIKLLQLIEDINSTELSTNTKKLANILLLKCKRGVSIAEYNMELNFTKVKTFEKLNIEYLLDLEDTKNEMYYESKRAQDLANLERKIKEELGLEHKKDTEELEPVKIEELLNDTKEYTFDGIHQKICPSKTIEEAKEEIKKLKAAGAIYEPKNGVYKFR